MSVLFIDTETYSEVPIGNGTYAYVEGVEVMITSWAIDDGDVIVSDHIAGDPGPFDLYDVDDFEWIVIHGGNGPTFDRLVLRAAGVVDIPVHKVWDTAVQARSHGLPGGLDKLCQIFKVPEAEAKHKDGKKLIQLFCKPRPKNVKIRRATPRTHPVEWDRFLSYAGGDIHAMRYIFNKLPRWNYPTREHGLWQLDQRINERGFQVDVELAEKAIDMIAHEKGKIDAETQELTDGYINSTTQRDALLRELMIEHGVTLPDLTKDTIERRLEDENLPEPVKDLLRQRLMTSTTSTAKYSKILKAMSPDQRMRGSLLFCGAPGTKRWSGKIFQPQNLPRPDMDVDEIERGIEAIKGDYWDMMVLEPMRLSWNALRGLIIAGEGKKLVQADLSQIEARVLPWLAEEEWKLKAFAQLDAEKRAGSSSGLDMYKITAGRLLGKAPEDVTKDERQSHGKVVELACGYQGAAGAFAQFAALYGVDMPEHEVMEAVRAWREANPAIADWTHGLWTKLNNAAIEATVTPGRWIDAGRYIKFKRYNDWLIMRLPSGGYLSFASPKMIPNKKFGGEQLSYMGVDSYTRRWKRIPTYGGKLSAFATQATARELLAHNMQAIDKKYPIILQVHDEVLTETPDTDDYTVAELAGMLAARPDWIDDKLPLAADGFEDYRYRKD